MDHRDRAEVPVRMEDDHVAVIPVRRVAGRPALDVRDDVRTGPRGLLAHHVPRVDDGEERLPVRVLHRRALDDHEGRPHAGVEVDRREEHDHDDPRDQEVPRKTLPEMLVLFLVILVSRTVAGHGPFGQGWESVYTPRGRPVTRRSWRRRGAPDRRRCAPGSARGPLRNRPVDRTSDGARPRGSLCGCARGSRASVAAAGEPTRGPSSLVRVDTYLPLRQSYT